MLDLSYFNKKVSLLVQSAAKRVANKRIEKIRRHVVQEVKNWRLHVRFLLSRRYAGGRNTSLWPRLRTGALMHSVPTYSVKARKTFVGSKVDLGQTVIQLTQRDLRKPWTTYGRTLNVWSMFQPDTQLDGWQDRAYEILNNRVQSRIKGIIDYD